MLGRNRTSVPNHSFFRIGAELVLHFHPQFSCFTSFLSSRASLPSSVIVLHFLPQFSCFSSFLIILGPFGPFVQGRHRSHHLQVLWSDLGSGLGPAPPLKQDPTCVTCPAIFPLSFVNILSLLSLQRVYSVIVCQNTIWTP